MSIKITKNGQISELDYNVPLYHQMDGVDLVEADPLYTDIEEVEAFCFAVNSSLVPIKPFKVSVNHRYSIVGARMARKLKQLEKSNLASWLIKETLACQISFDHKARYIIKCTKKFGGEDA